MGETGVTINCKHSLLTYIYLPLESLEKGSTISPSLVLTLGAKGHMHGSEGFPHFVLKNCVF